MSDFLVPKPLENGADFSDLSNQWNRFKEEFDYYLTATEKSAKDDKIKIAILLRCIGPRGVDIFKSFNFTEGKSKDVYDDVLDQFESHCSKTSSKIAMRHQLLSAKQGCLTIDEYINSLHKIAMECSLNTMYDDFVLQALLLGINDDCLRRGLLEESEDLVLETAVRKCKLAESSQADLKIIKIEAECQVEEEHMGDLTDNDIASMSPGNIGRQKKIRKTRDSYTIPTTPIFSTPISQNSQSLRASARFSERPIINPVQYPTNPPINYKPKPAEIQLFLQDMDLHPDIVMKYKFDKSRLCQLWTAREKMEKKERQLISRIYSRHIRALYTLKFNNQLVALQVIEHTAKCLVMYFPGLADDPTVENRTHRELYSTGPLCGTLYDTFKNMNRGLPQELKARKRKKVPANLEVPNPAADSEVLKASLSTRRQIMNETFTERRAWIRDAMPGILAILERYPIFISKPEEINMEFERMGYRNCNEKFKEMVDTISDPIEGLKQFLQKLHIKNTKKIKDIIQLEAPQTVSNSYGSVVTVYHDGMFYVCIYGGYVINQSCLSQALSTTLKMFYILDLEFPAAVRSYFHNMAYLHGIPGIKVSTTFKLVLDA